MVSRHNFKVVGPFIEQCAVCGIFRCTAAARDVNKRGRKRKTDVEYSMPSGEIICLNPRPGERPPCCDRRYDNPENAGRWAS